MRTGLVHNGSDGLLLPVQTRRLTMRDPQSPNGWRRSQLAFWAAAYGVIVLFGLISLFFIVPAALTSG